MAGARAVAEASLGMTRIAIGAYSTPWMAMTMMASLGMTLGMTRMAMAMTRMAMFGRAGGTQLKRRLKRHHLPSRAPWRGRQREEGGTARVRRRGGPAGAIKWRIWS